jgi:ArsR family transcriptional regulator
MTQKEKAKYQARAAIIKALAHPTRLFLMDKLSMNTHCVCQLTAMVGDDITTISKHLSVLKNAGLVAVEKKGTQVFYHLKLPCIMGFLSCAEETMKNSLKEQNKLFN